MSTFQLSWRKGQNRFCLEARYVRREREKGEDWGENGTMYAHMNK
jgi:hypothetical protein